MQSKTTSSTLPKLHKSLLEAILDIASRPGDSMSALKFRAQHHEHLCTLDEMERAGWLRRKNNRYEVSGSVLPLLNSAVAARKLDELEAVYGAMWQHYLDDQDKPVLVSELAHELHVNLDQVINTIELMADIPLWCGGRSNELHLEGAYVIPSEGILQNKSFASLVRQVNAWSANLPAASPLDAGASTQFHSNETSDPPIDTERVLPAQQARNVLAAAEELANISFKPNDYYDDPEPRQFIDDVTNGLLTTMLAYCESLGWKRLSKQLRELIPLRGNQMENLSLIRDFIAPQVRSLVVVQDSVPPLVPPSEPKKQEANEMLPAWPAIRACLQEFSFYEIKELVGLGGMDVTALANLEQKAQGGASKGQLITAVDRLYGGMSATIQTRFLTTLIEEVLRRKPESQDKLDEYLIRLGWTFLEQRLVPIGVLRPETLDDTPEVCRSDLLKAAQRLRDGDLTGAISAACGAVDSATSQVYVEMELGDPTAASFQERCKRALQAKGVLASLDRQLQELGWAQAEIVSLRRNLDGALKQGAYVMQTLRSHMGDVHGSKPILRPLVFDCLRWAELIVASLVELADR